MSTALLLACASAARDAILAAEAEIEGLDRAIGDGDHYHNIKRGAETILALDLAALAPDAALKAVAVKLLSTIGGASGPLISSFFLAASRTPGAGGAWDARVVAAMVADGVAAIMARGKAGRGDKTMLDVLIPVAEVLAAGGPDLSARVLAAAEAGMLSTRDIRATKGRAAFLGDRAIGHIDPGAMSSFVIIRAICATVAPDVA